MKLGVLGPLSVWRGDRPVDVPSEMLRRLLVLFVCSAGKPTSADTLAEQLWCGSPPRTARKTLQIYVHRLRRVLDAHERLRHDLAGYALTVQTHELDAFVFEATVRDAIEARSRGDLEGARSALHQALGLWRGDAYAGFRDMDLVAAEADRLEERKLTALEERFSIDLDLGHHATLVSELVPLIGRHPYRERLRGQLMLALYRSGRQAEALQAYRRTRDLLVADLGVEPLPELQLLHQRILANDPELAVPQPASSRGHTLTAHRSLPRDVPDFAGRAESLQWLDDAAAGSCGAVLITAIAGTAGVGKTALAVHWAHLAANSFPDGQLYVNLRGYDARAPVGTLDTLGHLLRCLKVPPDQLPFDVDDASAMYRSLVHGKRMLILLDNARSAEQIRPLLPGDSTCLVLITSRDRLSGLIAREGAKRLTLGMLAQPEAMELVGNIIGAERVAAEHDSVGRLVQLCARLPLALRIASVHLIDRPGLTIAAYVDDLAGTGVVDSLAVEGDEHYAIRAVLDHSYHLLSSESQCVFRLLGVVPGPDFTSEVVAALADIRPGEAAEILDLLAAAHLIQQDANGRYSFHDLVREYARKTLEESAEPSTPALDRLLRYLQSGAVNASLLITSSGPGVGGPAQDSGIAPEFMSATEAMKWLELERANILAAVSSAAATGRPDLAAGIATPMWQFFHFAGHTSDWISTFECVLTAVDRLGDEATRCHILHALGNAYIKAGRYNEGIRAHQETIAVRDRLGDEVGAARSRRNLALSYEHQGRYDDAVRELETALATFRKHGSRLVEAMILGSGLTGIQNRTGQSERARDGLLEALAIVREVGTPSELVIILSNLGETYNLLGEPKAALSYLSEALEIARRVGDRHSEALALAAFADAHRATGDYDRAIELRQEAHELIRQVGLRGDECESMNELAATYMSAGRTDLARETYQEALNLAKKLGESHQEGRALAGAGMLMHESDPRAAEDYLSRALVLLEPISIIEADKVRESLSELRRDANSWDTT